MSAKQSRDEYERSRMAYEAPAEETDLQLLEMALRIHSQVCGCDDNRCTVTDDVYRWLQSGDLSDEPSIDELVAEWDEYRGGSR